MAQITNAAREKRFRAAVDKVTQSFTRVTYAKVAELEYNDAHADRFADLLPDEDGVSVKDARVDYVRQEFTREERTFGDAAMAKWGELIARLIRGTDRYKPFTKEMVKLGVAHRRLRTDPFTDGTYEIVFVTPEKSGCLLYTSRCV